MEDNKNVKTIMDPIHGQITIPRSFVDNLIDTDYFQRLRNIDQTGMKMLYPNAKHDRFSHSLGVYFLGTMVITKLNNEIEKILLELPKEQLSFNDNISESYWKKTKILFLIACLLHDIGHAPFSHSLEEQLLKNSFYLPQNDFNSINGKLKTLMNNIEGFSNKNQIKKISCAPHEQIGALLILNSDLSKKIEKTVTDMMVQEKNQTNDIFCSKDLCFIARMIMGIKYTDWHTENQIRNAFIELLNGENFDVDSLDYIIRDTRMSGISNVAVDIKRLLNSISVVFKTKHKNKYNLSQKTSQINNLNIIKIANHQKKSSLSLQGKIKGEIRIPKGTNIVIKKQSEFEYLKGKNEDKCKLKLLSNENLKTIFDNNTIIDMLEDEQFKNTNQEYEIFIKKAKLVKDFTFCANKDLNISLHGNCEIQIKGPFESLGPVILFETSSLEGKIEEIEILGNTLSTELTMNKTISKSGYHQFTPAFDKKAINLIANVLNARNYLYLWIYAHHKVVYYANFALPLIVKEIFKRINKSNSNDFPNWKLNYQDLLYLDDNYIWTVMKYVYYNSSKINIKQEIRVLIGELLQHKYKNSLYKSLVEFDLLFEKFPNDKKELIFKNIIQKEISKDKPYLGEKNNKIGGYLGESFVKQLNDLISNQDIKIKEMVVIKVDYKEKKLKPEQTYIKINDFITYSQISLFEHQLNNNKNNDYYFYLYYTLDNQNREMEEQQKNDYTRIIQNSLIQLLENKLNFC